MTTLNSLTGELTNACRHVKTSLSLGRKRAKKTRVGLTLALMVLAGAASGCSEGRAPSAETKAPLEVELDVFSGRPNPRWVVPEVERGITVPLPIENL